MFYYPQFIIINIRYSTVYSPTYFAKAFGSATEKIFIYYNGFIALILTVFFRRNSYNV